MRATIKWAGLFLLIGCTIAVAIRCNSKKPMRTATVYKTLPATYTLASFGATKMVFAEKFEIVIAGTNKKVELIDVDKQTKFEFSSRQYDCASLWRISNNRIAVLDSANLLCIFNKKTRSLATKHQADSPLNAGGMTYDKSSHRLIFWSALPSRKLFIYDLELQQLKDATFQHDIVCAAWSENGIELMSSEGTVYLYNFDLSRGRILASVNATNYANMVYSKSNNSFVYCQEEGSGIYNIDLASGKLRKVNFSLPIAKYCADPNSSLLYISTYQYGLTPSLVHLFNLDTLTVDMSFALPDTGHINSITAFPDGSAVAFGSTANFIYVADSAIIQQK